MLDNLEFPISRDPPEGGTRQCTSPLPSWSNEFPISRDPPEGGTLRICRAVRVVHQLSFQFLGIPPKGERDSI